MERAILALDRFVRHNDTNIAWVDRRDDSFWVVPRNVNGMLKKHLYDKKLPVVFTSATLSNKGNFDYFARTIGLEKPSKSTIGSPFDVEEQVMVYLAGEDNKGENAFERKLKQLVALLEQNGGRALVLTNTMSEVRRIREGLEGKHFPFELLWEDEADRGYLVRRFREEETSVLIGMNFWEGIDVPGDPLTMVVVWQLPFPVLDPLIEVQRKEAKEQGLDPVVTVDYPEMGLKLKQGCGRLIRKEDDKGAIVILDPIKNTKWEQVALGALPDGANMREGSVLEV